MSTKRNYPKLTDIRIALTLVLLACGGSEHEHSSASALETRIVAPCCWNQTLDVHESPLVTELRAEIRTRMAAGETAEAIEADFVARYGERVRAVPAGEDKRGRVPVAVAALMAVAAVFLLRMGRRWLRASKMEASQPTAVAAAAPDAYDAALDRELEGG